MLLVIEDVETLVADVGVAEDGVEAFVDAADGDDEPLGDDVVVNKDVDSLVDVNMVDVEGDVEAFVEVGMVIDDAIDIVVDVPAMNGVVV